MSVSHVGRVIRYHFLSRFRLCPGCTERQNLPSNGFARIQWCKLHLGR